MALTNRNSPVKEMYTLLDQLCRTLAPNNRDALSLATDVISKSFYSQSTGIMDEATIASVFQVKLQNVSPEAINNYRSTYEFLSSCKQIRNLNSVLSFLIHLSKTNHTKSFSTNMNHNVDNNYVLKQNRYSGVSSTGRVREIYTTDKRNPPTKSSSSSSSTENFTGHQQIKKYVPIVHSETSTSSFGSTINHKSKSRGSGGGSADITDDLMQDIIYSFTGIQGKYLRKNISNGEFRLGPHATNLNICSSGMLLRLSELGYYHNQVLSFTDKKNHRCPIGLLGQGLISVLNIELTQYYGMVALLQEQLNRQKQMGPNMVEPGEKLTILKVMLWASEPLHRMQWLSTIADSCHEKKGGALASAIYNFMAHGDPTVKHLVKDLLCAVCLPLHTMLSKWILDGEIEDPHLEFFIEVIPDIRTDRLWYDKYRLKENLLPNFISKQLAQKILVTGKCINYLCEVCEDKSAIKGREDLKQCLQTNIESLFSSVPDTKLHLMIESIYFSTSKKVLDIIMGPHRLLYHLQALRRYLLLGQGDFINLLMENLKPELDRPARDLYRHNLSSIMDSTMRATNAQFDDPDIMDHLDVKLMDAFEGDCGWDIFSLRYTIRGPLSPILEPSMTRYESLFKALWNAKHVEFVLSSKIWKEQKLNSKILRNMGGTLNPITRRLNLFTSEMNHFIHQMQYYILFEVLECSWALFLTQINSAKTLDDILLAHNSFLDSIMQGTFLDEKSQSHSLSTSLQAVYDSIMRLEAWQDKFYEICFREYDQRKLYQQHIVTSESKGRYGVTAVKRFDRDEQKHMFVLDVQECHKSLNKIAEDYEEGVRKFLLALASSNDNRLQLFGTRLDFNEYYKKRDQRLGQPLTFEHIRMSTMFFNKSGVSINSSKFNN